MNQSRSRFLFHVLCISAMLFFSACQHRENHGTVTKTDSTPRADISVHGLFSNQQQIHLDSIRLDSFFIRFPLLKSYAGEVNAFYGYRHFLFAWYDSAGLTEQASNLINHLHHVDEDGVQTPVPYLEKIDSLINDPEAVKKGNPDDELLLTAEYFFYADKVWKGISEEKTNKLSWLLPRKKLDLPYLTDSLLKDPASSLFKDDYNFNQYELLKKQLRLYRKLDSSESWQTIKPLNSKYKLNDSSEQFAEIRHRLFLLGDLASDSGNPYFDDSLETAVKSFQQRNGMETDAVMGAGFFREFNMPLKENIRRLIVNMERTRWIAAPLSKHYLIINIPAFTLSAYDQDTLSFSMNVVVGKDLHQTVIFNGDIKYIVFSPYWNVPPSILKKEILPAIKRDPNYLSRNHMEWNGNAVRQKPGPKNSLGLVKFLFPNSHNIYLHDSPAKSLFGAASRAFSHGCIRLAEPKKLADYLLKDDPSWTPEKTAAAMNSGKEKYVTLKNPVPVYIGYMTAWVDNKWKLNFRKDIYRRDEELEKTLLNY